MIAKIVTGNSFNGVINYILDKNKNAEIIGCDGVRIKNKESIIDSFNTQLEMNPNIKKPVYHISLDFSAQDIDKLTNRKMDEIAKEYLHKMNMHNTQYIAVRHYDKEHPHIHLCINRIDYNGQIISNKNDRYKSGKACKELTFSHNLYFAQGKDNVKRNRLKEPDKTKYDIFDALKYSLPLCKNWNDLTIQLERKGIKISFKYKRNSNQIEGVRFCKNGYYFNGSKIDKQLSYSKIDYLFNSIKKQEKTITVLNKGANNQEHPLAFDTLFNHASDSNDNEYGQDSQTKKKRKQQQP